MKPTRWKSPVKEEKVIPKLSSEKTLKIEFGGRMHQSQWGYVSSDLMDELVELSEKLNDYDFPDYNRFSGFRGITTASWNPRKTAFIRDLSGPTRFLTP